MEKNRIFANKNRDMQLNSLTAISPLDGRYYHVVSELSDYFSEYAYIRTRVLVEIEYFIALCELPLPELQAVTINQQASLRAVYTHFTQRDALHIKEIEQTTNHDVKAVEYFIKEKFDLLNLSEYKEFIHFGLTSQDINNTSVPYLLREFHQHTGVVKLREVQHAILEKAKAWKDIPMLARTHGQPASPTTLGKEWYVFYERIENQMKLLQDIPFCGKFGGATGNFNAHYVAYPLIDWVRFSNDFLKDKLNLTRLQTTTQIEHYDNLAAYFDTLKRINTVLLDFDRDIWLYISMDYFKQQVKDTEVGSSAMPHKVNPIDFENSEGNICIANALFNELAIKLPVSRLQRDLTDSTVIRNIGVPLAHSLVAYNALLRGTGKLLLNEKAIQVDLDKNWAVVAEAIQTILRREKYPNPYETLKALTRGKSQITKEAIHSFIDSLLINNKVKEELKQITPQNYTGIKLNIN
ncbi:MAG: adenylosuccinate lyase [Bacteroidales bacterium]|jgi:adenylosuccinate lyase|nr:adenylosuccinate lyase [Bacteroidales bacterium]